MSTISLFDFGNQKNPINVAAILGVAVLGLFYCKSSDVDNKTLACLVLVGVLFVVMMWMTKSRGPILALIVTLFLYVMTYVKSKVLVSALMMAVLVVLIIPFHDDIIDRFMQNNHRVDIWVGTLELIKNKFIFGAGLYYSDVAIPYEQGRVTATHSHSFIFDALRVGGVVGVSLLSLVLLRTIVTGLKSSQRKIQFCILWLVFGCLCLLTNGQPLFYRPSISWLLFWLPLFLSAFSIAEEKHAN